MIELPLLGQQSNTLSQLTPSVKRSGRKYVVYFNEFNLVLGKSRYFPVVSGILRAYAETVPEIRNRYEFMPFLFQWDSVDNILAQYTKPPDIAAFSANMWNENLNLRVAQEVKKRWPKCTIVFGGYCVPRKAETYMRENSFIDICVRGEGEDTFLDILLNYMEDWDSENFHEDYTHIPNTSSYKFDSKEIVENTNCRPFQKDMDQYPSPYLEGHFNYLVDSYKDITWQAIIENARGCSFPCSFCAWGRFGVTTKYRFHSLNRVKEEIDWVVNYGKCEYMFCADANFLMHPRDMEIVDHLVEVKKTSGRDIKWRACYGKNSDEKIFRGALKLYQHGIEKGVTLARQSNDPTTLKNIRRQNISLGTYRNLQERFNDEGVPVYIELIIGLPGETKESWKKGIDDSLLRTGMKVTLFTHMCQVFANTEMYEPEYQEKYGIKTQKIVLTEMHASPRKEGWVDEYETIVIATDSLPHEDWREVCKLSWLTLFIHSMKAGVFVLGWLWDRFNITPSEYVDFLLHKSKSESLLGKELKIWDGILDRIVGGESRGTILSQYLDVYLEVEEAALLRCSEAWEVFYRDLAARTLEFLRARGIDALNSIELIEVIDYQRARMPSFEAPEIREQEYTLNIPEYFDKLFGSSPVPLERKLQILSLKPKTWANKEQYARETVLWGRKSGTLLVECSYEDEKSGEA